MCLCLQVLVGHLQQLVYEYVCRSLFKADRLMFAMHMVHGMKPNMFEENVSTDYNSGGMGSELCLRSSF